MEIDNKKIEELKNKLAETRPELKAALDKITEEKKKLTSLFEIDSVNDVVINGQPARLTLYKKCFITVQFRDMDEAKAAIEKLIQ